MVVLACGLAALVSAGLYLRYLYMVVYMGETWAFACAAYVVANGGNASQMSQLIARWPVWRIVTDVTQWDYSAYLVDQAGARIVLDFLRANPQALDQ